ncbi:MAG: site-specific integrase [Candidatus Gracilibacteria bacterium]
MDNVTVPSNLFHFPFSEEEWGKITSRIKEGETPLLSHWEDFVNRYIRLGRSLSTVSNIRETITYLLRSTNIASIEGTNDARFVADELFKLMQERGFSRVTFNSYLKNLNTYFIWMHKNNFITENNVRKVERCSEQINEQLVLNETQIKEIFDLVLKRRQTRLQRLRNLCFVSLLAFTGARPSEIANIKMSEIKKDSNGLYRLRVQGAKQNNRARYYQLDSWVRDSVLNYMEYKNKLRPDEPYLLISSSKKKPWGKKGIVYFMKKISNELGYRVNCYGFRRYVATRLYLANTSIDKIADYLGHVDTDTTKRYIESTCANTIAASQILKQL